jgi:DNA-binding GntR family transcriptional regulator
VLGTWLIQAEGEERPTPGTTFEDRRFGMISTKDRRLLQEALDWRCNAFMTMERRLVGADNAFTSCGLRILVDQAAEPGASPDADFAVGRSHVSPAVGWLLAEGPVRPVGAVVIDVLAEDVVEMSPAGDEDAVGALAPRAGDPALADRVRSRRPDRRGDDPHAGRDEDRVERAGVLGIPVSDQELGMFVTARIDYVVSAENPPSWHETVRLAEATPREQTERTELLRRPAAAVRKALNLRPGEKAIAMSRLRSVNDELAGCSDLVISATLCPRLDEVMEPTASLYRYFCDHYQLKPYRGWSEVSLETPPAEVADRLGLSGQPMLFRHRSRVDSATAGRPIYQVTAWLRPEVVRVRVCYGSTQPTA